MESFYCRIKNKDGSLKSGVVGIAVSDHILTVVDPSAQESGGFRVVPQVGVIIMKADIDEETEEVILVEDKRQPSPSYTSPDRLVALGLVSETDLDGLDLWNDDEVDEAVTPLRDASSPSTHPPANA